MREWLARIVDWFRRDRLDAELREELEFHRAQIERDTRADWRRRGWRHTGPRDVGSAT